MSATSSIRSVSSDPEIGGIDVNNDLLSSDDNVERAATLPGIGPPRTSNMFRYGSSARMPSVMEEFLYHSLTNISPVTANTGAAASAAAVDVEDSTGNVSRISTATSTGQRSSNLGLGSIFETSFDITEERLRRLFDMFDVDHSNTISYEEMKKGLEYHGGGTMGSGLQACLDENSFDQLMSYLDADKSGDITFEEFSEGIRLIMLRSLLRTMVANSGFDDSVVTEVFDYNAQRLERHLVEGFGQDARDVTVSHSVYPLSIMDFFFAERPEWVKVRWINITGEKASHIMKMAAIKYRLHPLALEDALQAEDQRPKAESYSSHYFLMVPVFYLERFIDPNDDPYIERRVKRRRKFVASWKRWWNPQIDNDDGTKSTKKDDMKDPKEEHEKPRIKRIGTQMTSIFVSIPISDTVITFNNEKGRERIKVKIDSRHHTNLTNCWSRVQSELKKSYSKLRQYNGQYLTYSLLDQAVDVIGPIVKDMRKVIENEKEALRDRQYRNMGYIHSLRDDLKKMSRKLKPFMRLLVHVIEDETISPGPTVYLKDVLDNLENFDEEVKNLISVCESADVDAEKFQRSQMDSTLYTLTVISATFLPAQFLTGVWGMNFQYMPELDEKWGYTMFWILAVLLMISMQIFLNCGRLRA